MALIIVESPTKARTFNRILKGKNYYVFATLGHIRDLPKDKISIDYTKSFKPDYKIIKGREKVADQLKKLYEQNDEIILASDPDREGEAIAYHAAATLGFIEEKWPTFKVKEDGKKLSRIVFHEITPTAIEEALKNPGKLRESLVKAQQARRILDRIVGYELSPLLWIKMGKNWLSAGRVQTVALRLVVEREKEIANFNQETYYKLYGIFQNSEEFKGELIEKEGKTYEITNKIKLFDGEYTYTKTSIAKKESETIKKDLTSDKFSISKVEDSMKMRFPPPPLTTSLLQQEGFSKFGFSSRMSMRLAQDLYERGHITYHRTDSFNLSTNFVFRAKDYITSAFGKEYALAKPRGYKTKSRMAQEAHEAIRPTHLDKSLEEIFKNKKLTANHKKLYELIFNRALATQMKEAEINMTKVQIKSDKGYLFQSEFQQVIFDGFLKVLNPEFAKNKTEKNKLKEGENVKLNQVEDRESQTLPPPRYNEASLIRTLEEKGIGRPSTYAPIISLIQDKSYVQKEGRYFTPTTLGTAISDYLSGSFTGLFDVDFTARMEEALDDIAEGKKDVVSELKIFYEPFSRELEERKKDKSTIEVEEDTGEVCSTCGKPLTVKMSRFGKFYGCTGYPSCKFTKPILKKVEGKNCPLDGGQIVVRYTKTKRRFFGCENYPKCKFAAFTFNELK